MSSQKQLVFVIPGDINTRTGGYRYDKRIIEELRARGWIITLLCLDGDFPFPTADQLGEADKVLQQLSDGSRVLIDGLAYSVMPEQLARHAKRLEFIALVHHPLALETDLTQQQSKSLKKLETDSLAFARHVITTSETTALSLSDYKVPSSIISAVCPGIDAAPIASGSSNSTLNLLCVATLTHRKGHAVLLDALVKLVHLPWHLFCAGSEKRDHDTASNLFAQCSELGLSDRISFLGEQNDEELAVQYLQADIFVLPSFHEGYGMVLDEAISYGLPIVASDAGAISQTIPGGAGLLVPPGDPEALAEALRSVMEKTDTRAALRKQALSARLTLRSWKQAAQEFEEALDFD